MNKKNPPPNKRSVDFPAHFRDAKGDGHGGLTGIANRIGEIDCYDTIVAPRSITPELLKRFAASGLLLQGHQYAKAPIGHVVSAVLKGRDITVDCDYFSEEESQRFRTIATELIAAGKPVPLSIGFDVSNYEWFDSGPDLLRVCEERGEDMKMFNVEQINAHTDYCWLMYLSEILEVSQVNWAANAPSMATDVRGVLLDSFIRALESNTCMTSDRLLSLARDAGILEEAATDPVAESAADGISDEETAGMLSRLDSVFTT